MPAEITTMRDCASNYGRFHVPSETDPAKIYTVTLNGSEGPAFCTCPAYEHSRDRHCKHIDRVYRDACLYNPQWRDGPRGGIVTLRPFVTDAPGRAEGFECPSCGGSMIYVRRAV